MSNHATWDDDKNVEDFNMVAIGLQSEGQQSRADAVEYLIQRVKKAEEKLKEKSRVLEFGLEKKALSEIPIFYRTSERDPFVQGRLIDEGVNTEFKPDEGGFTIYNPDPTKIFVELKT
jgi:hypothetical protein